MEFHEREPRIHHQHTRATCKACGELGPGAFKHRPTLLGVFFGGCEQQPARDDEPLMAYGSYYGQPQPHPHA